MEKEKNKASDPLVRFAADPRFCAEWRKMLAGEVYDAVYAPFLTLLRETRAVIRTFNDADPSDDEGLLKILRSLLGKCGDRIHVNQPFRCDYGCNISVGDNFFANFNLTILDEAEVTIGNNVFIGPNVSIFTACHPIDPAERASGAEWAEPVTIGKDVWIGGNTVILPGVSVGDGAVVGAGSVVTRDVPPLTVAAGNPCRVIRGIDPDMAAG